MRQMLRIFPDMHVYTPYPIQIGSGDWITVITRTTPTFRGQVVLPDDKVIVPTGKAFDVEFGQTTKWDTSLAWSSRWGRSSHGGQGLSPLRPSLSN